MKSKKKIKKILITGAAGYIGSMLCTELVKRGHLVYAVDLLKYNSNSLSHLFFFKNFNFLKADVTDEKVLGKIVKNMDFIIPLAALVGAPLCEKYKKKAVELNLNSIKKITKILKKNQKIIYPTSNSGYGIGSKNKFCDENSPLKPISLYGKTKAEAEKHILKHKNSICFRLATVFGFSYRMRTDLLVNNFVERSLKYKEISLFEPHFRRNFIHIRDVAGAFIYSIDNFTKLKNNIYNIGLSSANITKLMLTKKIKKKIPDLKIKVIKNIKDPDQRDYYVSNNKIEKKGFKAKISLDDGIEELIKLLKNSKIQFKNNY